jgi:hypothetical protein
MITSQATRRSVVPRFEVGAGTLARSFRSDSRRVMVFFTVVILSVSQERPPLRARGSEVPLLAAMFLLTAGSLRLLEVVFSVG